MMKEFFSITEDKYIFEIWDITTLITVLNVAFVLMGYSWAPLLGIANCILCIGIIPHILLFGNAPPSRGALFFLRALDKYPRRVYDDDTPPGYF